MTKLEELYVAKGQAHTQIEIGQQMLKDANQALSQELAKQAAGEKMNELKKDTGDTPILKPESHRKSS